MFKKPHSAITAIILDRTSALTNNQLTVASVWQPRLTTSNIASVVARTTLLSTDPLDRALIEYTAAHGGTQSRHQSMRQFNFSAQQGMSGNLWHHGADFILAVKGIPEYIINHCDLSDNERESILMQLQAQSAEGAYVVALAQATLKKPIKHVSEISAKHALQFVGFIKLTVTIPGSTKQLVDTIRSRGTKAYILTGQHPAAAYHLASQIGIADHPRQVLDSNQLELLSDTQIREQLASARVVARANIAEKRHITQLLHTNSGEVRHITSLDELRKLAQ